MGNIMSNQITMHINNSYPTLDCGSIYDLCLELRDVWSHANVPDVVMDFARCSFISVSPIVLLAMFAKYSSKQGSKISFVNLEDGISSYLSRMNFYKFLDIENKENFKRHNPHDKFLPIENVSLSNYSINDIGDKIRKTIVKNCLFRRTTEGMLDYVFGEIVDNIVQHSASEVDGAVICQYYPSGKFLEICIADAGIGIQGSLAANPKYEGMDSYMLLTHAFSRNTGQYIETEYAGGDKVSGGMGLFTVKNLVEKMGGGMFVISNDAAASFYHGTFSRLETPYYHGTLISIKVPTSSIELTSDDIFGDGKNKIIGWSPQEGLVEEDSLSGLW